MSSSRSLLGRAAAHAADFLDGLPARPVGARAELADLRRALDRPLPETGLPAVAVIEEVTGGWLKQLLGPPADASFAFTTGRR